MRSQLILLGIFLSVFASSLPAQRGPTSNINRPVELEIRLRFENQQPAPIIAAVEVVPQNGGYVMRGNTDTSGRARFGRVPFGTYRVTVTADALPEAVTQTIEIPQGEYWHYQDVTVKPVETQARPSVSDRATVSAADLQIPNNARKEYEKGMSAARSSQWKAAAEHLNKAIKDYPNFDKAYTVLGMVQTQQNDARGAEASFRKAVDLNGENARAARDLAEILVKRQQFDEAEKLLKKSLAVDPQNPVGNILLAYTELNRGEMDAALADAKRADSLGEHRFPLCHLIAARAYEVKQDRDNAVREYRAFLQEAPGAPDVPVAEEGLRRLNAATATK